MSNYKLTPEGEKYLTEGTPEKKLVEILDKKGKINIEKVKDSIENFHIALQWAKKNGWVELKDGMLHLLKKPKNFDVENLLERVSNGEPVEEDLLKQLLQRKLVEEEREDALKRATRLVGQEISNLSEDLIKTKKWKEVKIKPYNIYAEGQTIYPGKKQPYAAFLDWVKMKMISFGFEEMSGPLIETEFWNMDALFMPQHHSARDIHDAYFIKDPKYAKSIDKKILENVKKSHESGTSESRGWEYQYDVQRAHRHLLRTHCTVLSAKTLASKPKIPGKYFGISRCFRYDIVDATHLPDFYQIDGIILEENVNIRHLVGILKMFAKEFANTDKIKVVPTYFPFTEPSVELRAKHDELGWIELGGSGIFRKELTEPLGIKVPVIAWGIGIDRIGMFNMGINDIRNLFSHDLNYLRKTKVTY